MLKTSQEIENFIPRISPTHFLKEENAREMDHFSGDLLSMSELQGKWKVIGWAYSRDVSEKFECVYVVLFFDSESGTRVWRHATDNTMEKIYEAVKRDPSKIVPLR